MSSAVMQKFPWRNLYRAEVVVLALFSITTAVVYATIWWAAQNEHFAIEYEGHVLWACLKLSQCQNIYDAAALVNPPWAVTIYNPFYFLIGAALLKATGLQFGPLRVISMVSAVLAFVGFFVLLRRSRLSNFQSTIGLLLLASSVPVIHWSSVARVDMLGLCLAIWGIERFAAAFCDKRKEGTRTWWYLLPALALFLTAFYTKQQYFVFPLSSAFYLIARRNYRLAVQFTGLFLASAAVVACIIQTLSGGYFAHLAYATRLPWEWETLEFFIVPFLLDPKTVASVLIIATGAFLSRHRPPLEGLAAWLLAVSFVVVLCTMGVRAAYHNHLLCTYTALFWLAAINLKKLGLKSTAPAIMICAVFLSFLNWAQFMDELSCRIRLNKYTVKTMARLDRCQVGGKPILTEDPSLALFAGAVPVMVDATTILNMSRSNPQSLKSLLTAIDEKRYAAILVDRDDADFHVARIWPAEVVKKIWMNYELVGQSGGNGGMQRVFLPRQHPDSNKGLSMSSLSSPH